MTRKRTLRLRDALEGGDADGDAELLVRVYQPESSRLALFSERRATPSKLVCRAPRGRGRPSSRDLGTHSKND